MAAIDYNGIAVAIRSAILDYAQTEHAFVDIETEFTYGAELTPVVRVYLENRDAPVDEQKIRAGTATDYWITYALLCGAYSLEGQAEAAKSRNTFLADVEVAMMVDRTLGGKVTTLWLEGGQVFSARDAEGGEIAFAELLVTVVAQATT